MSRAVLITGASRGFGRRLALAFARNGAIVGIAHRADTDAAQETASAVAGAGGEPAVLTADLREPAAAGKIVRAFTEKTEGRIDVLINNAGIVRDRATARMSEEDWDDVLAIGLDAAYRTIKAVCRPMMRQREGHIINVASHAAVLGRAGGANYAAAKAGLIALTKSAARELGGSGVCVNAICPGLMEGTGMAESAGEEFIKAVRAESTLSRLADADEIAEFVVHLAGMRGVSGQVFALDSRILPWG